VRTPNLAKRCKRPRAVATDLKVGVRVPLSAPGAQALSQVFTETGQLDAALDISLSSAAALEPRLREDRDGPEEWSVWGALLLTAALAAARDNDLGAAWDYLRRAGRAADRIRADRNDLWTSFGPTNVAIHGISVAVELGDVAETIRRAEQVNTTTLPPGLLERRANVLIDLGRGCVHCRDDVESGALQWRWVAWRSLAHDRNEDMNASASIVSSREK
jgi:hypothetical protein